MPLITKLNRFLYSLNAKKLFALTFLLGACSALGFAPLFWFPFSFIGFSAFLFILSYYPFSQTKIVFWTGWFFGLGYFVVGLYWIALSLHVNWWKFGWLFPIAVLGIPAVGGIYTAVVAYLTNMIKEPGVLKYLAFGAFWSILEWIRGHIFPLFPWLLISDIWLFSPQIAQTLSVIGSYGLSLVTIYLLTLPALAKKEYALGGLCLITTLWFSGDQRLKNHPTEFDNDILLYLVQPNIAQDQKWSPENIKSNLEKLYLLSKNKLDKRLFIIWPESGITFTVDSDSLVAKQLSTLLKKDDYLAFGEPRFSNEGGSQKVYNSLAILDNTGKIVGVYDKSRLVHFGEYLPLRTILPDWMTKLSYGSIDYSRGDGLRTLLLPNTPGFSPLICYEVIFPGEVTPHHCSHTSWIVNITNDGWFLNSSGPQQHFQMARARAIEEGVPVARVANTGISGLIDPYGRVIQALPYGIEGILIEPLPKPIPGRTLYVIWRDIPYLITIIFLLGAILWFGLYRKSKEL